MSEEQDEVLSEMRRWISRLQFERDEKQKTIDIVLKWIKAHRQKQYITACKASGVMSNEQARSTSQRD